MRITIYDKNPGEGFFQLCLALSWAVGCYLQKYFGFIDEYYGASSWEDALNYLNQKEHISSLQFWGHGSPGLVYIARARVNVNAFVQALHGKVDQKSTIWFRSCSTFQGESGYAFSKALADSLGCTIAGHTRIIGVFQGGLYTRLPHTDPSWPVSEGEFTPKTFWTANGLKWGNRTVVCLATRVPDGW